MSARALFLDRDGIINEEVGYLYRADDVRFVPGIFDLCRTAQALQYRLIVVTNQAGIARGLYTEADFHILTDWMQQQFELRSVKLDAVYYCPFHPQHGVGRYKQDHADRKPGIGMLRRGAAQFGLELQQSVLVGDRCSDIAAANTAGLREAFLMGDIEKQPCPGRYRSVRALADVEAWLSAEG